MPVLVLVSATGQPLLSLHIHLAGFCWDTVYVDPAYVIHCWRLWPRNPWTVCCLGFVRAWWPSSCWNGPTSGFPMLWFPQTQTHHLPDMTDFFWSPELGSPFCSPQWYGHIFSAKLIPSGTFFDWASSCFLYLHLTFEANRSLRHAFHSPGSQEHAQIDLPATLLHCCFSIVPQHLWSFWVTLNNSLLVGLWMVIRSVFLPSASSYPTSSPSRPQSLRGLVRTHIFDCLLLLLFSSFIYSQACVRKRRFCPLMKWKISLMSYPELPSLSKSQCSNPKLVGFEVGASGLQKFGINKEKIDWSIFL